MSKRNGERRRKAKARRGGVFKALWSSEYIGSTYGGMTGMGQAGASDQTEQRGSAEHSSVRSCLPLGSH